MNTGVNIRWLGQAGFEIVSPKGTKVVIDPYLGDSCMKLVGFKRMMPSPMTIEEFEADALLVSHEHPDHLDIDLLAALSHRNEIPVYGNDACRAAMEEAMLDKNRISRIGIGDRFTVGDIEVTAVPCDHGDQCVEPLGFLLGVGGVRIYFSGDTAYNTELLQPAIKARPDVALLPINGMYGNLDSKQAAALAADLRCELLIPCHYWMFVEHGGDPLSLQRLADSTPDLQIAFLAPGETIHWEKR